MAELAFQLRLLQASEFVLEKILESQGQLFVKEEMDTQRPEASALGHAPGSRQMGLGNFLLALDTWQRGSTAKPSSFTASRSPLRGHFLRQKSGRC